ncbi:Uncharacterised protein [Chlamydia trachomatis]|nr:Uncharacterised protein [Chlamydia trachomatis]
MPAGVDNGITFDVDRCVQRFDCLAHECGVWDPAHYQPEVCESWASRCHVGHCRYLLSIANVGAKDLPNTRSAGILIHLQGDDDGGFLGEVAKQPRD